MFWEGSSSSVHWLTWLRNQRDTVSDPPYRSSMECGPAAGEVIVNLLGTADVLLGKALNPSTAVRALYYSLSLVACVW